MRFGERVIQFDRSQCGGLCLWKCLAGWYESTIPAGAPHRRNTPIGQRVAGVLLQAGLEVLQRGIQMLARKFVPMESGP